MSNTVGIGLKQIAPLIISHRELHLLRCLI
nr:MAG TPA: hypothetical protein [Caudoviricetes sp.]